MQPKTQYLITQLNNKLTQGQKYQLYTEFTGELADDLAGFYRSEYQEDGVRKWVLHSVSHYIHNFISFCFYGVLIIHRIVATSQMHPTHARKVFPCFDEPAMKAVFYITLIHPPGTVALSNGMEKGKCIHASKFKWDNTIRCWSMPSRMTYKHVSKIESVFWFYVATVKVSGETLTVSRKLTALSHDTDIMLVHPSTLLQTLWLQLSISPLHPTVIITTNFILGYVLKWLIRLFLGG